MDTRLNRPWPARAIRRLRSSRPPYTPPGYPQPSGEIAQSSEKALVLGAGAVAHPQAARPAQRGARPDGDAGSGERGDDLALVEVAQLQPPEVRLRVGRGEAHPPHRVLNVDSLDQVSLDAVGDIVGVADRLGGRRLGEH